VIDHQDLPVGAGDGQPFGEHLDGADERVVKRPARNRRSLDVVARPQPPEPVTAHRQLPHQLHQPRIIDVRSGQRAQPGHRAVRDAVPAVAVQPAYFRVEEHGPDQVDTRAEHRAQGRSQRVRREDVQVAVLDEGRRFVPGGDQLLDRGRRALGRPAMRGHLGLRQPVQVGGGILIQPQGPGHGLDDLR